MSCDYYHRAATTNKCSKCSNGAVGTVDSALYVHFTLAKTQILCPFSTFSLSTKDDLSTIEEFFKELCENSTTGGMVSNVLGTPCFPCAPTQAWHVPGPQIREHLPEENGDQETLVVASNGHFPVLRACINAAPSCGAARIITARPDHAFRSCADTLASPRALYLRYEDSIETFELAFIKNVFHTLGCILEGLSFRPVL